MGLPIAQISNAALQKLAYLCDNGDSNYGTLNEQEFLKFKNEAAKRKDISDEDFNQAMGLYISNPALKTEERSNIKFEVAKLVSENTKVNDSMTITTSNAALDSSKLEELGFDVITTTALDKGKVAYKVKFGDSWTTLANKLGLTAKFGSVKEAVKALAEMTGYDIKMANSLPGQIEIDNEMAGCGSKLNPDECN